MDKRIQIALVVAGLLLISGCIGYITGDDQQDIEEVIESTNDNIYNISTYSSDQILSAELESDSQSMNVKQESDIVIDIDNQEYKKDITETGLTDEDRTLTKYYLDGTEYIEENNEVATSDGEFEYNMATDISDTDFIDELELEESNGQYILTGEYDSMISFVNEIGGDEFGSIDEKIVSENEDVEFESLNITYKIDKNEYKPDSVNIDLVLSTTESDIDGNIHLELDINYDNYNDSLNIDAP